MKSIFYIIQILLILVLIGFVLHSIKLIREYFDYKKEYCLAPKEIKPGHVAEVVKSDYEPILKFKLIELLMWFVVIGELIFAVFDLGKWI